MSGSGPFMAEEHLSAQSVRKSLEALIAGERKNQVYFLLTSVVGLLTGAGLIWWTVAAHLEPEATSTHAIVSGAIPIITSALSVTRIVVCESRIAQYKAAAALKGTGLAIAIKLIERTILQRN